MQKVNLLLVNHFMVQNLQVQSMIKDDCCFKIIVKEYAVTSIHFIRLEVLNNFEIHTRITFCSRRSIADSLNHLNDKYAT